jgi:hypothetical protein
MSTATKPAKRPRQFTLAERMEHFPLDFTVKNDGTPSIKVPEAWEKANLLRLGPYQGGVKFSPRVHLFAAAVFSRFFAIIEVENVMSHIRTYDGGYVPRLKRGVTLPAAGSPKSAYEKQLSNHSRGTAIDLNAGWNPIGKPYDAKKHAGQGSLAFIIALAERVRIDQEDGTEWGIVCGAHWEGASIDPMHFEIGVWP